MKVTNYERTQVGSISKNEDIVESLYFDFLYKKDKRQPEVELEIDFTNRHPSISSGYHSFLTKEQALFEVNRWYKSGYIIKAIKMEIPKGTKYIKENNLLVSSTIIWRE